MKRTHLFACVLIGCTSSGGEGSPESRTQPDIDQGPEPEGLPPSGEPELALAKPPGVPLQRGISRNAARIGSMTEVWLDPRASAALSLDALGNVRLWPALPPATTELAALTPIVVPILEPTSLSLARAGANAFVIAAIDTSQYGRVIEVEIDAQGHASVRDRFAFAPSDPLLELHVLDGGQRLLALGVDHRIRLYDGQGKQLAELAEYGLAPWQLRMAGPPEALQFAMVLAGPTRLQRFTITDDRMERVGEAHPVTLGRGPNHNDLTLLPSGRVAALLRRPSNETLQWSLELHDLDSGEIRVMWGEVDSKLRPRLHILDDQRALLEDGSGAGFWIDLRGGMVMPAPFELPKLLEELPPESHVTGQRISLPGSGKLERRRASVVAGVRVVPSGSQLLLDPIDSTVGDRHYRLGYRSFDASALALDQDGTRLAIAIGGSEILIESLVDESEQLITGCAATSVQALGFSDREHLVVIDADLVRICEWQTGKVVSELALGTVRKGSIRRGESGSGELAVRLNPPEQPEQPELAPEAESQSDEDEREPVLIARVTFTANQLGALEPVARADLPSWPDLLDESLVLAIDAKGQRYSKPRVDTRYFEITPPEGERRKLKLADRKLDFNAFEPSPDGRWAAIEHQPETSDGYGGYYYSTPPQTLSLLSITDESPETMWSIPVESWQDLELTWSADSSRLAFEHGGVEVRVVTPEGEQVFARSQRAFQFEELPDPPPPVVDAPAVPPPPARP